MARTKLHLGCGKRNFGKDWIHADKAKFDHIDFTDVIQTPIRSSTIELIYASHLIAYFSEIDTCYALTDWKRILKPGGILRLATPDFNAINRYYQETGNMLLGPLYGHMEIDSYHIYHKTCYDLASITKLLEKHGFEDVKLYDWRKTEHAEFDDHSQAYMPHMDKENGLLISLNVECKKK